MSDEQPEPDYSALIAHHRATRAVPRQSPARERPWTMGFGPVLFRAGETRRIDAQPKCPFRPEKVCAYYDGMTDAHLLGLYVGREEILNLGGDSIDLGVKKETVVATKRWSEPALPIEIEIVNRSSEDRMIALDILGTAIG